MSTGSIVEKPELLMDRAPATASASSLWQWAALGAIVLGSFGHLLIKMGVTAAAHQTSSGFIGRLSHYLLQPAAMSGLLIYSVGTLLWIYAVSQRNISFLYPLTALTYVAVAVGGKFMFGENISGQRWIGIAVVVIGVGMLQLSAKEQKA